MGVEELAGERECEVGSRWLHYMSCVAHDLKTPLTCFQMAIDEIAQDDRQRLSAPFRVQGSGIPHLPSAVSVAGVKPIRSHAFHHG